MRIEVAVEEPTAATTAAEGDTDAEGADHKNADAVEAAGHTEENRVADWISEKSPASNADNSDITQTSVHMPMQSRMPSTTMHM